MCDNQILKIIKKSNMFKFNVIQIGYFLIIALIKLTLNSAIPTAALEDYLESFAEYSHSKGSDYNPCDTCLRWTDWISLGDTNELASVQNTYQDLVNLAKHAAGYYGIDMCAVPVSSDCQILVTDAGHLYQDNVHLACPYAKYDADNNRTDGVDDGWAQMRFLCWDHTCPCLEWSRWYNYDGPRDEGDIEILGRTIPREDWPCPHGTGMLDVECRTTDGRSMTQANNRMLQCDFQGFQCLNDLQDENCVCQDFMVRFLCLEQGSPSIPSIAAHDSTLFETYHESDKEQDYEKIEDKNDTHIVEYPSIPREVFGYSGCLKVVVVGNNTNTTLSCIEFQKSPEETDSNVTGMSTKNESAIEDFVLDVRHYESSKPKVIEAESGQASAPVGDVGAEHRIDVPAYVESSSPVDSEQEILTFRQQENDLQGQLFNRQKETEILKLDDGTELIIEGLPSKAVKTTKKPVTKTTTLAPSPPTLPPRKIYPVRPHYSKYSPSVRPIDRPPTYRRPQPPPPLHFQRKPSFQMGFDQPDIPSMEWSYWGRDVPTYVDRRFYRPNDAHNYDAERYGAGYNPQTGEYVRYRVSDSRRGREYGRNWQRRYPEPGYY